MTRRLLAWGLVGALAAGPGCARPAARTQPRLAPPVEPTDPVVAAALPFRVVDGRTGKPVATESFFATLGHARAVCVGEAHPNPHHHWLQLHVLGDLVGRAREGGRPLALGMEMFRRPSQPVLDDYAAGRIDEATLLERVRWPESWGWDFGLYRALVTLARSERLPILALNAPKEVTRKIARVGLEGLAPDERAALPELDLRDARHRATFEALMAGHGVEGPGLDRYYAAQVVWDETMAETAARWLEAEAHRQMVIVAGSAHCHDRAIPARLRRRGIGPVLAVQPIVAPAGGPALGGLGRGDADFVVLLEPDGRPVAPEVSARAARPGRSGTAPDQGPLTVTYAGAARRILDAALADDGAWQKLAHLADRIGPRLAGSEALDRAIAWAEVTLRAEGHEAVRRQPVMVPRWVRGVGRGSITAPVERELALLALGGSSGTPRGGLEAEVVVVRSFAELDALGAAGVRGKVVLFNRPMRADLPGFVAYREVGRHRFRGPARAASLGAAGALVRSVTTRSLRTPHTGRTVFPDGTRPIPAAAVATEDADLIARLARTGPVRVRLVLGARTLPDVPSANVLAELRGRERPEEIVLLGAYLDSWDVGPGAHDNGAGVAMVMQALTVLRRLDLRPRRTIRIVLFTNEENGVHGSREYARVAAATGELERHVAALEADSGGYRPEGFRLDAHPSALPTVRQIAALLAPIGATRVEPGPAGTDVGSLRAGGVPLLGLAMDETRYFDIHHTAADTLDKVSPDDLRRDVAAVAVMAYVLADMPGPLPRTPPAAPTPPTPAPRDPPSPAPSRPGR